MDQADANPGQRAMRVLLAHDASPGGAVAVSVVDDLHWPDGTVVRVVGVVEPLAAVVPSMPMAPARLVVSPELDAQIVDHLRTEVDSVVGRLREEGVQVDGEVLRGRPASVLVDEAARFRASLVVVGSRGHGPIASLVLGSVSAELVDQAPCPVLVARRPEVRRVLFATDGSPSAERAEAVVAGWSVFEDLAIRVVSVAEVVRPWLTGLAPTMYAQAVEAYGTDVDEAVREQEALAHAVAARLEDVGRRAHANVLAGDAAAAIIEEAESWNADLIVLGSRGLTGLSRVVLGSVARNVLLGSARSVLVVREHDERSNG